MLKRILYRLGLDYKKVENILSVAIPMLVALLFSWSGRNGHNGHLIISNIIFVIALISFYPKKFDEIRANKEKSIVVLLCFLYSLYSSHTVLYDSLKSVDRDYKFLAIDNFPVVGDQFAFNKGYYTVFYAYQALKDQGYSRVHLDQIEKKEENVFFHENFTLEQLVKLEFELGKRIIKSLVYLPNLKKLEKKGSLKALDDRDDLSHAEGFAKALRSDDYKTLVGLNWTILKKEPKKLSSDQVKKLHKLADSIDKLILETKEKLKKI